MYFSVLLFVFLLTSVDHLKGQLYDHLPPGLVYPATYSAFGTGYTPSFSSQPPFYGNLPPPPEYLEYLMQPQGSAMFGGGMSQGISSGFSGFPRFLIGGSGPMKRVPPFGSFRGGYGALPPPFMAQQAPYFRQNLLAALITDKDNFQIQGCGWDGVRQRCTDILGICKGGCRDFSTDQITHDCRCVPFGYAVLYNGSIGQVGKKKKK